MEDLLQKKMLWCFKTMDKNGWLVDTQPNFDPLKFMGYLKVITSHIYIANPITRYDGSIYYPIK